MTSRAQPAAVGGESGPFEHRGVFFDSAGDLCTAVTPRIRAALAADGPVVVAVTPPLEAAVRASLTARERGAVRFADRAELYDAPGRTLAALHRLARTHEPRRVTVVAEPELAVPDPVELREWHRLDSVLQHALAGSRMRLICLHDARELPPPVQRSARHTHPALICPREGERANPDYRDPVAFSAPDATRPLPAPPHVLATLDIRSDLPALREEVSALAASAGLPEARDGDLVVAVNELAANVLEHGAGKGTITLWRAPGRVGCDVVDECGDLTDPLIGYHPTDALSPRGYGLWITRQVCDFMQVTAGPHGSVVRLRFRTA